MKYAVAKCSNGNFFIVSEHETNKTAAVIAYFAECQALYNAPDVITATVKVVDENLNTVDDKFVFIIDKTQSTE